MRIQFLVCISFALLFSSSSLFAQSVYTLKADSVKITNCDSSELILENHTQGVKGFLYNKGNGRTEFRRGLVPLSDTQYVIGADTLHLSKILAYSGTGGGTSAHRVFMLYTRDFASGNTVTYTMAGWNAQYSSGTGSLLSASQAKGNAQINSAGREPVTIIYPDSSGKAKSGSSRLSSINAASGGANGTWPLIVATLDFQMYLPSGTTAGTVVTATLQGTTIYTMTVSSTLNSDSYIVGSAKIIQDLKYPNQFYGRKSVENIYSTGQIANSGYPFLINGQSFVNPSLTLTVTGNPYTIRLGCTYTVDKMQPGDFQY